MAADYSQRSQEDLVKLLEEKDGELSAIKQQAKSFVERLKLQHQEELARLKEEQDQHQAKDTPEEIARLREKEASLQSEIELRDSQLVKVQEDAKKYVALLRKKEQDALESLHKAQDEMDVLRKEVEALRGREDPSVNADALKTEVAGLKQALDACEEENSKVKKQAKRVVEQISEKNKELLMELTNQEDVIKQLNLKVQTLEAELTSLSKDIAAPVACTTCESLTAAVEQLRRELVGQEETNKQIEDMLLVQQEQQ
eukprot:768027-Hanusia_phi.AAC.1